MKKIAILSRKGGTGKTYFSINLSVAAELDGHTTVLLDLDPQSSSAKWGDNRAEDTPAVLSTHSVTQLSFSIWTLKVPLRNGGTIALKTPRRYFRHIPNSCPKCSSSQKKTAQVWQSSTQHLTRNRQLLTQHAQLIL